MKGKVMIKAAQVRKAFLLVFAVLALGACSARAGELRKVTFKNDSSQTISIVYIWYNAETEKWMVDGWYKIQPGGTGVCGTYSKKMYYYAYAWNSKQVWGGDCDDSRTVKQTIVKERMFFESGKTPSGTNRRRVCFNWLDLGSNLTMTWRLWN